MVIKNFSSRYAQACSSRAFMPPDCTPGPSGSQHLLNVVVLAARGANRPDHEFLWGLGMQSARRRVECAHGDGNTEGSRATRRDVDTSGFAGEGGESSVLSALEPTAGGMPLRRIRGGAVPAVLCGEAGAAQLAAGGVLPAAADWLPRGYRFGAWDRLAES